MTATASTFISLVIGVAIAALLSSRRIPGADLIDTIATAPLVLPPTVLGYYVLTAIGRRSVIGHALESLTGHAIVFTMTGVILASVIGGLPIVIRTSRAAFESVDRDFIDAARVLGAGPVRTLMSVRIPMAARGIAAAAILAFARSIGDFGLTLMIAGNIPGETRTASLAIYDALQSGDETAAAQYAMILTALSISILYGATKLTRQR